MLAIAQSEQVKQLVMDSFKNEVADRLSEESTPEYLEYPGDLCCRLWRDKSFGGNYLTFCLPDANTSQGWDMRDYGFDDQAGSRYCGKNVAYEFCDDPVDSTCAYSKGLSGAGTWAASDIGHNDNLTYLHMEPYDVSELGAVTLFEHPNCTGTSGRYYASTEDGAPATYTEDEMKHNNICNDCVTTLLVPYGYSVTLY